MYPKVGIFLYFCSVISPGRGLEISFLSIYIMLKYLFISGLALMTVCCSCSQSASQQGSTSSAEKAVQTRATSPQFCADSAFYYVKQQLDFGPRVPGSDAQQECATWLENELTRKGAIVKVQRTEATAYDGTKLPVINIVGSYKPEAKMRVLLMSHWDCRHVADNDPDASKRQQPVDGANDGASGVGVLLELARLASNQLPQVGIDIFLTDVEDYGAPDDWKGSHDEKWWAMGTQLWCQQAQKEGYRAQYGILLDMVGAPDATFYREYYSERYASTYVDQIWRTAAELGYGQLFVNRQGGGVTDDHVFVNKILGVPTVDVIDTRPDSNDGSFYPYWHTTEDTLDKLSAETMQKVGNVLVKLLW